MALLYRSKDDGTFYEGSEVDDPSFGFTEIEVPEIITLTPTQICGSYGDLLEILLKTNQAVVK